MNKGQKQSNHSGHLNGSRAIVYTLFLPLNFNSGRRVPKEQVNGVLSRIVRYAGGLTKYSPSSGFWISPSALVVRDLVLPVQVVVPPSQEAQRWFTCFASELAVLLEQECIFLVAQPLWLME